MKKGIVGFIFGVVSVIAVLLGIIKKMSKVTNVISHLKDDLSEGFRYLIFGENDTTKLRKYSGRYPFNSYYNNNNDDYYYYRGPYNEYSASFKYSIERQNAIEALDFDTEEEARDIFDKLVEASDGKKLTVEQFLNVADPDGEVDRKYLDSKFGWWYNEFFNNCIRIEKDDRDETCHFIIPRPVCLGEDAK